MSTFSIQVFTSIKNNYQKASTIKKIIVTLQNNSITMKDLAEKSLLLWQEEQTFLRGINADTPQHEYEQALVVCENIHPHLINKVDKAEYIDFLFLYADLFELKGNLKKEIDIQDEIVSVRRKQVDENRGEYLSKLSRSLYRASLLHRDAVNVRKAIDCMEEHLTIERAIANETGQNSSESVALALYFMANTYARFGRNILAEDTYIEAVEVYYNLIAQAHNVDATLIVSQILIEFADFYVSTGFFDKATDRYTQAIELLRTIAPENEEAETLLQQQYIFMRDFYDRIDDKEKSNHYAELLNNQ